MTNVQADFQFHGFIQYSMERPWHRLWRSIQHIETHCTDLQRRPLARICTDLPKFDVERICMENVQQDHEMQRIARILCSCLVIFRWVHVTALQFPDTYMYVCIYIYIIGALQRPVRPDSNLQSPSGLHVHAEKPTKHAQEGTDLSRAHAER